MNQARKLVKRGETTKILDQAITTYTTQGEEALKIYLQQCIADKKIKSDIANRMANGIINEFGKKSVDNNINR